MERGDYSDQHLSDISPGLRSLVWIAKLASGNAEVDAAISEIEKLANQVGWRKISELAERHGMKPFLNQSLASNRFNSAPQEMAQSARKATSALARHNLLATADLIEILSELERNGILAIPVKGPALAWLLYRDISLREFSDLDLLIDGKDLGAASRILETLGYEPELELSPSRRRIFVTTENVLLFTHSSTGRFVEMHWELSPRYLAPPIDIEIFRKRLRTVEPGGRVMKAMSEEDTLIYLCAHGAKHYWEKLNWVTDIATLINRSEAMDWSYIFEQAEARRSELMLLLGLSIAQDLLGTRTPDLALEYFRRSPIVSRLTEDAKEWLLTETDTPPGWLRRWIFYSRLQKGLPDKLRFAYLSLAAPNTVDWQSVDLPDSLSSLYYFARPLRLFAGLARRR